MKLITIALMLLTFAASAQTDTVYIVIKYDEMKGNSYLTPNRAMTLINAETKQGIKIQPYLNNDRTLKTLFVRVTNIGTCNEKDELILLLDNDYRVITTSWKSFNCDGESYYNLQENDIQQLKHNAIKKIRYTNSIKGESCTIEVPDRNKSYFINLFKSLDSAQ